MCGYYDGEGYCERTGRKCPYSKYDDYECSYYVPDDKDDYSYEEE